MGAELFSTQDTVTVRGGALHGADGLYAVSYTHLHFTAGKNRDAAGYGRHTEDRAGCGKGRGGGAGPVSYTHLAVYKRQTLGCALTLTRALDRNTPYPWAGAPGLSAELCRGTVTSASSVYLPLAGNATVTCASLFTMCIRDRFYRAAWRSYTPSTRTVLHTPDSVSSSSFDFSAERSPTTST